jgi:hypothetical protein
MWASIMSGLELCWDEVAESPSESDSNDLPPSGLPKLRSQRLSTGGPGSAPTSRRFHLAPAL